MKPNNQNHQVEPSENVPSDFFSLVERRALQLDTRLCIGIDPHPEFVNDLSELETWSLSLATQTAPYAACFKVNIAFFEAFGSAGMQILENITQKLQDLAPVLLDAKRGDISSTGEAYARAAYERWGAQGLTVNPYLGMDGIEPYLRYPQAGLFVLCHTSNPSAARLQRRLDQRHIALYQEVVDMVNEHPESERIGFVVGATQPTALAEVRRRAPHAWLLCPGIGAQGGNLKEVVAYAWGDHGRVLISSSRAIAKASQPALAAQSLRDDIRQALNDHRASLPAPDNSLPPVLLHQLAKSLLDADSVLFGSFTLKSGIVSPIYIDLRRLTGNPKAFATALRAYQHRYQALSQTHNFIALAALPLAGLPLATGLAIHNHLPLCYPRPPKQHGTRSSVEGGVPSGSRLLMVDDLATRGVSAVEALESLRPHYQISDLLVLIDRESGADHHLRSHGVDLHAVTSLSALLDIWESSKMVPSEHIEATRHFLTEKQ